MNKLAFNQRAIIRSLSAAVVVLDQSGHVTLWNLAAERLLGIAEGEALGQVFWTLEIVGLNRASLPKVRKSLSQNVATRLEQVTYELPGGIPGKALLSCVPIVDGGAPLGAVITFEDVTRLSNALAENAKLKEDNGRASKEA
jgi:two-component system, chemotaxis family, CheB/CheR fusion protein